MLRLYRARQLVSRAPLAKRLPSTRLLASHAPASTQIQPMTKIEKILLDTIKVKGPISFSEYMSLCLSHPTEGYYMKPLQEIVGARGDFITSPEISQVFGELICVWLSSLWLAGGEPCPLRIVELGPGTGSLMRVLLWFFWNLPASKVALKEIHLVETSPTLRLLQQKKLEAVAISRGWKIFWHESIDDVPRDNNLYTMLVANEFFDALPFHLIEKTREGWQEVLITSALDLPAPAILTPSNTSIFPTEIPRSPSSTASRFRQVLSSEPTAASILLGRSFPKFQDLPVGTRVEASPMSFKLARKVAELISTREDPKSAGGSALIIDYGSDHFSSNSFRAFKDHKIVDVFRTPGDCDLTVNVDFSFLKEAMDDLVVTHGSLSQADFLTGMGIDKRTEALKESAPDENRKFMIEAAAKRLIDPNGMGKQYRVLGITNPTYTGDDMPFTTQVWPFPIKERPS